MLPKALSFLHSKNGPDALSKRARPDLRRLRRAPGRGSLCLCLQFEASGLVVRVVVLLLGCLCVYVCVCVCVCSFVCVFVWLFVDSCVSLFPWLVGCLCQCVLVFFLAPCGTILCLTNTFGDRVVLFLHLGGP